MGARKFEIICLFDIIPRMKETVRNIRTDLKTLGSLLHSLSRASWVRPSVEWWDQASKDRIGILIDRLSKPNEDERLVIRRILGEQEVQSVLDVGSGISTEYQSYRLNGPLREADYVGIDRSKRMLNVARGRYPGIKLVRGNVESLPFTDKSFDAVVVRHIVEHQPDGFEKTVSEAVRVARKCVIIDFFHKLLPIEIKIGDCDGYANNWYKRRDFEDYLLTFPIAYFDRTRCVGTSGQWAEIYTIVK